MGPIRVLTLIKLEHYTFLLQRLKEKENIIYVPDYVWYAHSSASTNGLKMKWMLIWTGYTDRSSDTLQFSCVSFTWTSDMRRRSLLCCKDDRFAFYSTDPFIKSNEKGGGPRNDWDWAVLSDWLEKGDDASKFGNAAYQLKFKNKIYLPRDHADLQNSWHSAGMHIIGRQLLNLCQDQRSI